MKSFYLGFVFLLFLGCSKQDFLPLDGIDIEEAPYITSNEVLERAYQMASIEWTPIKPVPKLGGQFYSPGVTVKGVPYSSVKEINTYLFLDVSYHTFMTAVHNPESVLYTEDISKAPYHGDNCATYYGSVCSSSVMYALGISIPYYTSQIIKLPEMRKLDSQVIDSLKICDVIWKPGHVQMVYDVEYEADTLYKITTFESTGKGAHLTEYTKTQFKKMWDNDDYVGYRYNRLVYSQEREEFHDFAQIEYNDDLCPSKGDKAVYRTTDTVTINIFNPNYDRITISKDNNSTTSNLSEWDNYKYYALTPGIYTVYLSKGDEKSKPVSFEVVNTEIAFLTAKATGSINVFFHSSAQPQYVALCDMYGNSECFRISSLARQRGFISVPRPKKSELFCKVVFQGVYGRIINEPLKIQ